MICDLNLYCIQVIASPRGGGEGLDLANGSWTLLEREEEEEEKSKTKMKIATVVHVHHDIYIHVYVEGFDF